jgi:hypothetical protein
MIIIKTIINSNLITKNITCIILNSIIFKLFYLESPTKYRL